jgi:hypothetical protein
VSQCTNALAHRLEQGAGALAAFASALTDPEWQARVHGDGCKIGVVVHHVATMYPPEIQLAQTLAGGQPVTRVTWDECQERQGARRRPVKTARKMSKTAPKLPVVFRPILLLPNVCPSGRWFPDDRDSS